jgi:hypothetical protein
MDHFLYSQYSKGHEISDLFLKNHDVGNASDSLNCSIIYFALVKFFIQDSIKNSLDRQTNTIA